MVLEKIIQGLGRVFSRRAPLAVDPALLTLLVETQKTEQGSIMRHLKKGEDATQKLKLKPEQFYVVYVHDTGTYKIEIAVDENSSVAQKARFEKRGVYLMHPFIEEVFGIKGPDGDVAIFGRPDIGITAFGSKQSHEVVLQLFKNGIESNRTLENHFELAEQIKKKRDSMQEDKTDYYAQI